MTTSPSRDEYLAGPYDELHKTPIQEKFRRIAPMPVGVVFIEWPGMTMDDIRRHFRMMKEYGVTCLKGISLHHRTDRRAVMHAALDEGLIPWWYGEAGWEEPTPELLTSLGIDPDTPMAELRENEAFLAHQEKVMRNRVDEMHDGRPIHVQQFRKVRRKWTPGLDLSVEAIDEYVAWLKETYGTTEALYEAWNVHHTMVDGPAEPWENWDAVEAFLRRGIRNPDRPNSMYIPERREYRRLRDVLRFKADLYLDALRERMAAEHAADPHAVTRAGGEMGLFLPFVHRATDMEGIAEVMSQAGSFYPSIHLAWHFEEVGFEIPRPVYMQAAQVVDWFKGGWSATWESTGGPQQLSGGKGDLFPPAADMWPGSTVDAGVMKQLMFSYLAAGFRGFGMWCWNARTAGWEAGEFALLDRNCEPTDRTVVAGQVGQAARHWRDELWQAHKEPEVGIFTDFDSDAIWAAASVSGRDFYKNMPVFSRIGAARAFIDANVPFEFVTGSDIRKGLAGRYRTIVLPATLAIARDILAALKDFASAGGRVVLDMPGAWYDDFGRLLPTAAGTDFEQLFGASIRDYQYSRNVPRSLEGRRLEGFVVDLGVTTARVRSAYDNGLPAVTENACGAGTGVILGWEASLACKEPGDADAEARLVTAAVGHLPRKYECDGAIVYRLAAPAADHYFFINDGPATQAAFRTPGYTYRDGADVLSGEAVGPDAPLDLEPYSGRWLRLEK